MVLYLEHVEPLEGDEGLGLRDASRPAIEGRRRRARQELAAVAVAARSVTLGYAATVLNLAVQASSS
jgi:hypothetical protein